MESGGSVPHPQGLSNNPYLEPNQSNSSIGNYFFKIHSNIVLRLGELLLLLLLFDIIRLDGA